MAELLRLDPNPGPQWEFLRSTADEVLYGGAAGGGKGQPLTSRVVTPFGHSEMGALSVGSLVSNPDGTTAKVLQVHPLGMCDVYRVSFIDGASVQVTADHLWLVWFASKRVKADRQYIWASGADISPVRGRLATTAELCDYMAKQQEAARPYWPIIPLTRPVTFTRSTGRWGSRLVLPPYALGALLGDGCFRGDSVGFTTADEFLIRELATELKAEPVYDRLYGYRFNVSAIKAQLQALSLWGKRSEDKSIPDDYLYTSIDDRWAILQGLMDTDGYADARGHCEFASTSRQLADQVQWLVRSLGGKATLNTKPSGYKRPDGERVECLPAHVVYIQTPDNRNLFRLPRKRERAAVEFNGGQSVLGRRATSIEPDGQAECQCITVDHPNGLYLAEDFIVTHNSYGLLLWAAYRIEHPAYRCLLLRRTYPELLMSLIDESKRIYPYLRGAAGVYNESNHRWTFPSGSQITFGSCEHETSVFRYQSAQFAAIGFDQLESFTRHQYTYMLSRNRNLVGLPNQIRATANPGGPGGPWVKRRFIDALSPYQTRWFAGDHEVPRGTRYARSRQFIPARVTDNPQLMASDPGYVARLMALPARERAQLLDGRWDMITEGVVYDTFDSTVHVVEPFDIPSDWRRIRAIDFGYNNPFVCQWWAINHDREMFLYREIYEPERLVSELGPEIKALTGKERIAFTVADHDAENRAELNRQGIPTVPAIKAIRAGIQEVTQRMQIRPHGRARIYIMRGCTVPWRTAKTLYDPDYPRSTSDEFGVYRWPDSRENRAEGEEPIDQHNHGMDTMRYACMALARPRGLRSRAAEGV